MLKVLLVILLAVIATSFAMDNMHHVELGLIVGRPVRVRVFFLLLTSFLIGCVSGILMDLYLGAKSKRQRGAARNTEVEDDFFAE